MMKARTTHHTNLQVIPCPEAMCDNGQVPASTCDGIGSAPCATCDGAGSLILPATPDPVRRMHKGRAMRRAMRRAQRRPLAIQFRLGASLAIDAVRPDAFDNAHAAPGSDPVQVIR